MRSLSHLSQLFSNYIGIVHLIKISFVQTSHGEDTSGMNFVGHRGGYRPRALQTEKIFSQADARTSVAVTGPTSLNASHEKKGERLKKRGKERGRDRERKRNRGQSGETESRKSRGEMGQANEWVE